ncbi:MULTISPECIES: hypothetical protein [unclassified Pseudomonas]|uniref:hypothetical protein n=1 Tax=unclassified Pseudomonas TaxID=196821 RepID=UPI0030D6EA07
MTFDEIIDYFNEQIKAGENLLSPARSKELQLETCNTLEQLLKSATANKFKAIKASLENESNILLGYECAIGSVLCELRMWILLKLDKGNEAWDQLIGAQIAAMDALRAHNGFCHAASRIKKLETLETTLFPPQSFLSVGFISKSLDCSICGDAFAICDHLRGKPYMGMFCEVIHRDIVGDHIALVETPADKRCRVTSYKVKIGHTDKITLNVTPYKGGEKFNDNNSLEVEGIFFATDRYPYLKPNEDVLLEP